MPSQQNPPEIVVELTATQVIAALASRLAAVAAQSIEDRGCFLMALAGGSTPRLLYQLLAQPEWQRQLDWTRIRLFLGDERNVAPSDSRSNFRMVKEALLDHLPPNGLYLHRWVTECGNLRLAAREYEAQLRSYGGRIDLVLLGLGDDGHTASLFPSSEQLDADKELCVATAVAPVEPHVARLTMTFRAFRASRQAWFLVTGGGKAQRVRAALQEPQDAHLRPTQGVHPEQGSPVWFLDQAAAALL